MTERRYNVVGIGEILWDLLPKGKQLGGAPANFAYVSKQLGDNGIAASRIGNDEFGNELLKDLANKKIAADYIQIDAENQTGIVRVSFENGQPNYEIVENVAWDNLEFSESWRELAEKTDAVCFGSLAQRNKDSRKTIREFVSLSEQNAWRIFDVNLRQFFFRRTFCANHFGWRTSPNSIMKNCRWSRKYLKFQAQPILNLPNIYAKGLS
jgi:fructokinase